jgi:peptide/nickel transport system substrate-binding protein
MNEGELRRQIELVRAGVLSRRRFIGQMAQLGLGAPMACALLTVSGVAMAQAVPPYKPTRRGGGGLLRLLWWQAPTLLNPHFAVGQKDLDATRIFYEPLAGLDPTGRLHPILATEIPSLENGGVARDGRSVTWRLKRDVT